MIVASPLMVSVPLLTISGWPASVVSFLPFISSVTDASPPLNVTSSVTSCPSCTHSMLLSLVAAFSALCSVP